MDSLGAQESSRVHMESASAGKVWEGEREMGSYCLRARNSNLHRYLQTMQSALK